MNFDESIAAEKSVFVEPRSAEHFSATGTGKDLHHALACQATGGSASEVRLYAMEFNDTVAHAASAFGKHFEKDRALADVLIGMGVLEDEWTSANLTPSDLDSIPDLTTLVSTTDDHWVARVLQTLNGASWTPITADVIARAVALEHAVASTPHGWGVGTPPQDAACWRLLVSAGADPRLLPTPKPLPPAMRAAFMDNWDELCRAKGWRACHPQRDYELYVKQLVRTRNAIQREANGIAKGQHLQRVRRRQGLTCGGMHSMMSATHNTTEGGIAWAPADAHEHSSDGDNEAGGSDSEGEVSGARIAHGVGGQGAHLIHHGGAAVPSDGYGSSTDDDSDDILLASCYASEAGEARLRHMLSEATRKEWMDP
jgi:hypothetical protein